MTEEELWTLAPLRDSRRRRSEGHDVDPLSCPSFGSFPIVSMCPWCYNSTKASINDNNRSNNENMCTYADVVLETNNDFVTT